MTRYGDDTGSSKGCFFWGCMTSLGLGALVVAGIGGLFFFGYQGQESVRDAGRAYLEATGSGELEAAYELLSPAFKEGVDLEGFIEGEQNRRMTMGECSGWALSSFNMQTVAGKGSLTELGYRTLCDGRQFAVQLMMIKVDGEWRIEAVQYVNPQSRELAPTCPGCGHPIQPGSRFCANCGEPLADEASGVDDESVS